MAEDFSSESMIPWKNAGNILTKRGKMLTFRQAGGVHVSCRQIGGASGGMRQQAGQGKRKY
jgi:hypothetical protein